jgi:hypothetical protein
MPPGFPPTRAPSDCVRLSLDDLASTRPVEREIRCRRERPR